MNDRQRFEDAYRRHSAAVVAYVARRTDAATAADVVSESFMVAWRRIGDLPSTDGQRAWLIAIARNVLANTRRAERRRLRLVNRASNDLQRMIRDVTADDGMAYIGLDGSLVEALESLDPDDRELLTLIAWDGLTRAEICQVLDCSSTALRTRIHRARVRFRTALDDRKATELHRHAPSDALPYPPGSEGTASDRSSRHDAAVSNVTADNVTVDNVSSTNSVADDDTNHNAVLTMRSLGNV